MMELTPDLDKVPYQSRVAEIANDQFDLRRQRLPPASGEIVDHDDFFIGVEQFQHHVGADITGAAGDKNGHFPLFPAIC